MALYGLGEIYKDLGKFKEAEIFYKKSLLIEPKHSGVHNSLGYVQKKSGNMEDAEINYRAAISLRPNFPMAYNNLGILLFRLRKWNESIYSYKKAISLDQSPNNWSLEDTVSLAIQPSGHGAPIQRTSQR